MSCAQRGAGRVSVIFTVSLSGASALATVSLIAADITTSGATDFSMSMVNTTSSAVNGWPSLHITPSRSFNVSSV